MSYVIGDFGAMSSITDATGGAFINSGSSSNSSGGLLSNNLLSNASQSNNLQFSTSVKPYQSSGQVTINAPTQLNQNVVNVALASAALVAGIFLLTKNNHI